MPVKKRIRSTSSRFRSKSKASKKMVAKTTKSSPVVSGVPVFGPRAGPANNMYTTFIYSERFPLAAGAAAVNNQVFALSSINDPNQTGAGGQPVNHDQYAAMFEKYLVYGVEVIVQAVAGTGAAPLLGCTVTDESFTTTTDPRRYTENGQTQWALLSPSGGTDKATWRFYVDNAKVHGISKKQLFADDAYRANFNANPQEGIFLNCWIVANDTLSATGTSQWHVELRYKTWMIGGKINTVS